MVPDGLLRARVMRGIGRLGPTALAVMTAATLGAPLFAGCGPESYKRGALGAGGGDGDGAGGAAAQDAGGDGDGGGDDSDGGAGGEPDSGLSLPTIRYDFETDALDGWMRVGDERPVDVLDTVTRSTDVYHNGTSSLAMGFDGMYTPPVPPNPFYGVYTATRPPPAGAKVTLWMLSTAPGVSVNFYVQTKPDYLFQALTLTQLATTGSWYEITVQIPDADIFYFGCVINSPFDIQGGVYLDEVSW
jgi:hypothetical protein